MKYKQFTNIRAKTIYSIVMLCLFFYNCSTTGSYKNIVLKAGGIEITRDEYIVLLNANLAKSNKTISSVKQPYLDSWNKSLAEDAILLAEAQEKGYQDNTGTNKIVEQTARQMILQRNGILYNAHILKNINITDEILNEAAERSKTLFDIEYMLFPSKRDMEKILGQDTILNHPGDFSKAVKKCTSDKDIIYAKTTWYWLSNELTTLRDKIYSMNTNEVSPPLKNINGIVIVCVKSKYPSENNYDKTSGQFKKQLEYFEEHRLSGEFDKKMYDLSEIEINDEIADKLWDKLKGKDTTYIKKSAFTDIPDKTLLKYKVDGKLVTMNAAQFIDFYNDMMVREVLGTKVSLYYYIKDAAWQDQSMKFATGMGLLQNKNFITEKNNYKNNLVITKLIRDRMKDELDISDEELLSEYNKVKDKYNMGESVIASLFYFNNTQDALQSIEILNKELTEDSLYQRNFKGLVQHVVKANIRYTSKDYPREVMDKLFEIDADVSEWPIEAYNKYIIFKKHEVIGQRYTPFNDLKAYLKSELYNSKFASARNKLLNSLKDKFQLYTNFPDYKSILKPKKN